MSQNTRWVASIKAEALREAADALDEHKPIPWREGPRVAALWLRTRAEREAEE